MSCTTFVRVAHGFLDVNAFLGVNAFLDINLVHAGSALWSDDKSER